MRKKTVIILVILFVIVAAAMYGWNEYHRTNASLVNRKADYEVNAGELISEFEKSDTTSEKKYLGKLVQVDGTIKQVEKDESNDFTVVLGESTSMSGIRCSMDTSFRSEAATLKTGDHIMIKGMFTGYQKDETGLLGSDIILNRAVITKEK